MADSSYWLTRLLIQRSLGFIYLIAFLAAIFQFRGLLGDQGLLPYKDYLNQVHFWDSPSLFYWIRSETFILISLWIGAALSILILVGVIEKLPLHFYILAWFVLWGLYLSLVNIGQTWYGFGWESLLCEAGFLAIFLGSRNVAPPVIVIWLYRWLLFRLMFGAGMIKLRGDECWRDLTCMVHHYETQPIPNPLSPYFHFLPRWFHKIEVAVTHFVEVVLPFGYFVPGLMGWVCGLSAVLFQVVLILSGNLSWLNYLTIAIAWSCFDDRILAKVIHLKIPELQSPHLLFTGSVWVYVCVVVVLSIQPAINLFSRVQKMNASFDPFRLVNTYGAFGNITKVRREIVLEGTLDEKLNQDTQWEEYEFQCKPGKPERMPCVISPYHPRLDWLMWFAAMGSPRYYPWVFNLVAKLLDAEPAVLNLLRKDPFEGKPPTYVRANLYEYQFAAHQERREAGVWWKRKPIGVYLPPLNLEHDEFRSILESRGWLKKSGG